MKRLPILLMALLALFCLLFLCGELTAPVVPPTSTPLATETGTAAVPTITQTAAATATEAGTAVPTETATSEATPTERATLPPRPTVTVTAPPTMTPTVTELPETYTVQRGDWLIKIAIQLYGGQFGWEWRCLYATNRARIGDNPNLIFAGQRLEGVRPCAPLR